jgi:hypothetical protein
MLRLFSESEFLTDHNESGVNKFGYRQYICKFLIAVLQREEL